MKHMTHPRNYSTVVSRSTELQYLPQTNYLFDLDYLSVIHVEGDKASEFLQGQLSCDMRAVTHTHMQQGLMCNLKGRVMSILDVVLMNNQTFALVVPEDMSFDTQSSLAKPAMFSRVTLHPSSYMLYGLFVQNTADLLPFGMALPSERHDIVHSDVGCCYKIDDAFYIYMIQPEAAHLISEPFISQDQYRGSLAWHVLQLQHQRVEIYPESRGLFLPHRLDLHLSGYINFDKGCYKGQEIIARMHYRSTQKYNLVTFTLDTATQPQVGAALYAEDGETIVGELVDYAMIDEHRLIISASVLISFLGIPHFKE